MTWRRERMMMVVMMRARVRRGRHVVGVRGGERPTTTTNGDVRMMRRWHRNGGGGGDGGGRGCRRCWRRHRRHGQRAVDAARRLRVRAVGDTARGAEHAEAMSAVVRRRVAAGERVDADKQRRLLRTLQLAAAAALLLALTR